MKIRLLCCLRINKDFLHFLAFRAPQVSVCSRCWCVWCVLSAYCTGARDLLTFWRSINRLAQKNQYNREDIFQKKKFTCWLGTGQRFVYGYYDIINNKTMNTKLVRTYFLLLKYTLYAREALFCLTRTCTK